MWSPPPPPSTYLQRSSLHVPALPHPQSRVCACHEFAKKAAANMSGNFAKPQFVLGLVVVELLLFVLVLPLLLKWLIYYEGGFHWYTKATDQTTEKFFNIHPLCMVLGFIIVLSQGENSSIKTSSESLSRGPRLSRYSRPQNRRQDRARLPASHHVNSYYTGARFCVEISHG